MSFAGSVRLGIIGCGRIAELGYVPAALALPDVELVAVADPDRSRHELLAKQAGAKGPLPQAHASAAAMLDRGGLDAVVIASPPDDHPEHAALAAGAGLACLVEKPPGRDLAAAQWIAQLDPAPAIGFNRRFQHGPALLEAATEDEFDLDLDLRYRRTSWRPHTVADEALLDLAPHLVDLALFLTGSDDAEVVRASHSLARAELELTTARGRALIRCASDRPYRERITIRRAGRTLAASSNGGAARALLTRLPGADVPLVESIRSQLGAFSAKVRGEDPGELLASAGDGVRVMRVIDNARELAAAGADTARPVALAS